MMNFVRSLSFRVEVDNSHERLGKMIRNGEKAKIPILAVVGEKEVESQSLSIRTRAAGELGAIPLGEVIERLQGAILSYGDF